MFWKQSPRMTEMNDTEILVCRAIDSRRKALARRIDMLQGHIANKDWHAAMDECSDIQAEEEVIKDLRAILDDS